MLKKLINTFKLIDGILGTENVYDYYENPNSDYLVTSIHTSEDIECYLDVYEDGKEDYTYVGRIIIGQFEYKFVSFDEEELFDSIVAVICDYQNISLN